MMLTEEKAKTKWCPEVIASHTDPRRGFHPGEEPKQYHQSGLHLCIGSACMAWRWSLDTTYDDEVMCHRRQGYCGKAGEP